MRKATLLALLALLTSIGARADDRDAATFITVATGSVTAVTDPRVPIVRRQVELIDVYCEAGRRSSKNRSTGSTYDMLAKAHSLLHTSQSLLELLTDFVQISHLQCNRYDDVTLVTLYVLARNDGMTHVAAVMKLEKSPQSLIDIYSKRK